MKLYAYFIFNVIAGLSAHAAGTVTTFISKTDWQSVIQGHDSVTFTNLPPFTIVTNQYAAQGILFTDGNDYTHYSESYQNDGTGLNSNDGFGNFGRIALSFSQPRYAIGVDFLSFVKFEIYSRSKLLNSTVTFSSDLSRFAGLVSTAAFDRVVLFNVSQHSLSIDDLYFRSASSAN